MSVNTIGAESRIIGDRNLKLLRDIERHLRHHSTKPTRFGRDAVSDPRFVFDLRNGREPRTATIERVRAFLEEAAQ
ncbi:hypothetical protein [Sphingomonas sp.]|jgi:hypothetical protein|uniref:hypothetical protein n=1 Tax=Sphingomonas sp. TaxID=28214 RepID=UPI0025D780D4|nr:hypothetical protein [Sphingomonas sp.]